MAITPASMRTRFPGTFDAFADDMLTACIDEAGLSTSTEELGNSAETAQLYLAAHLALASSGAHAQGASSAKAGEVSLVLGRDAIGGRVRTGFLDLYEALIRSKVVPLEVC